MELPSRNGEILYTRTVQRMHLVETWQKVLDRGRAGQGMPLEKATCEGRPAENADLSHMGIWGESIPSQGARVAGRVSRQSVGEEARSSWRVLWTSKGTWAFTLSLEGVKQGSEVGALWLLCGGRAEARRAVSCGRGLVVA